MRDVPAGERFTHFKGVQVSLTDRDNKPLTMTVTPGTTTAASASSLTITGNDGSTKTFGLDDRTMVRGKSGGDAASPSVRSTIAQNAQVIVVTLNGSTTASAVVTLGPNGVGPRGPFGH